MAERRVLIFSVVWAVAVVQRERHDVYLHLLAEIRLVLAALPVLAWASAFLLRLPSGREDAAANLFAEDALFPMVLDALMRVSLALCP